MSSLSEEVRIKILCEYIFDLKAENAKLRELIADVWNDAMTRMDFVDRHEFIDEFFVRMRELRVEV